jgi:predicted dehydrogenase
MIRTGMVGLGKMGLSHLSIARAHPEIDLVAGCDATAYLTDILGKHAALKCYARSRPLCSRASSSTR